MISASLIAIAFSAAILIVLGHRDPKRLRSTPGNSIAVVRANALSSRTRATLGWLSVLPGAVLAIAGEWSAFFIWLGATCVCGWVTAQVLSRR